MRQQFLALQTTLLISHIWAMTFSRALALDIDPKLVSIWPEFDRASAASANAVTISGNFAFLADGLFGLQIFEGVNRGNPTWTSRHATRGAAKHVSVVANYAYVAASEAGVEVLEISDRSNPRLAGSCDTSGYANRVVVSEGYAFVADGEAGIQIIDVRNPSKPVLRTTYAAGSYISDVAFRDGYLYVARSTPGPSVFDVRDPVNPSPVSANHAGWVDFWTTCLEISETRLYVVGYHGLDVLDVSDPAAPSLIGTYSSDAAQELAVVGNTIYLVGSHGLHVLDISELDAPKTVARFDRGGTGVAVSDRYVFIAEGEISRRCSGFHGLTVLDLHAPANPQRIGEYQSPANEVVFSGNLAYATSYEGELEIIDITNLHEPVRVGRWAFAPPNSGFCGLTPDVVRICGFDPYPDMPGSIAVSGNHAFLAGSCYGLQVVDISNPVAPTYARNLSGVWGQLAVHGEYLYGIGDGLEVFDIKQPQTPVRISRLESVYCFRLSPSGHFAYVLLADRENQSKLNVVDVRNPTNLVVTGTYKFDGYATTLTSSSNGHVYLAGGALGVIDVNDPTNPRAVGAYRHGSVYRKLAVAGPYLYAAHTIGLNSGPGGFEVIDVRNPAEPRRVSGNSGQIISDLDIINSRLVVAGPDGFGIYYQYEPIRFEAVSPKQLGSTHLRFTGPAGVPGYVQRSGNLVDWEDWLRVNFRETSLDIAVPDWGTGRSRFYRIAVAWPL